MLRQYIRTLLEVDEKVVRFVNKIAPRFLPFEELFKGKKRMVVPLPPSKEIRAIVTKLKRKGYTVDLQTGRASKDGREMRLGKVIGKELGQEVLDKFAKAGGSLSVVVSRMPIDVLRMSDFEQIQSCHSQGSEMFNCAIEETQDGGAIAFVVRDSDLKKIDLEAEEIFEDDERDVSGIKPIARMRLRRFMDLDTMEDIAIPDTKVYGHEVTDLATTLQTWAVSSQPILKSKKKREIAPLGGMYFDTSPVGIVKKLNRPNLQVKGSGWDNESQEAHSLLADKVGEEIRKAYKVVLKKHKKSILSEARNLAKQNKVKTSRWSVVDENGGANTILKFHIATDFSENKITRILGNKVSDVRRSYTYRGTIRIHLEFKLYLNEDKTKKSIQNLMRKLGEVFALLGDAMAVPKPKPKAKKETIPVEHKKLFKELGEWMKKSGAFYDVIGDLGDERLQRLGFYYHALGWDKDDYTLVKKYELPETFDLNEIREELQWATETRRKITRHFGAAVSREYIQSLQGIIKIWTELESLGYE